ncbi:hypothetical protein [Thermotoga profunda]|nr:hypothetical protein [Thermotoga profunda]
MKITLNAILQELLSIYFRKLIEKTIAIPNEPQYFSILLQSLFPLATRVL